MLISMFQLQQIKNSLNEGVTIEKYGFVYFFLSEELLFQENCVFSILQKTSLESIENPIKASRFSLQLKGTKPLTHGEGLRAKHSRLRHVHFMPL